MISDEALSNMVKQTKMIYEDKAKSDIKEVLTTYTDLSPKPKWHVFPDNTRRNALCLTGTIPVSYRVNLNCTISSSYRCFLGV